MKKIIIGDSVSRCLTPKAERAMAKALLRLEVLRERVCLLEMKTSDDSIYIESLRLDILQLTEVIENYKASKMYSDNANAALSSEIKILKRQVRREKIKSWIGGVMGGTGAAAVGVVAGFFIAQYK